MAVKDRRRELGILLSLGERKWRLVAQYAVEIGVIALLALGISVLAGREISQRAGNTLLANQVSSAAKAPAAQNGTGTGTAGSGATGAAGAAADSTVQTVKPIDKINVVMEAGDVGKVAGVGLGIALAAVLIPGTSIVRTSPRAILAKGD
jgi:putative ABC transport system permease protein